MHKKKKSYFHVMQAQGGPSRAELRDGEQQSTPGRTEKVPVKTSSWPPKQNGHLSQCS